MARAHTGGQPNPPLWGESQGGRGRERRAGTDAFEQKEGRVQGRGENALARRSGAPGDALLEAPATVADREDSSRLLSDVQRRSVPAASRLSRPPPSQSGIRPTRPSPLCAGRKR